jgi:hypothetical protein
LAELKERNPRVDVTCRRIDDDSAEFAIYRGGKRVAFGGLWVDRQERWASLKFSQAGVTRNAHNESMSVEDDGYVLGFRPMGIASHQSQRQELLTAHGAGEYFWTMLTERLRA